MEWNRQKDICVVYGKTFGELEENKDRVLRENLYDRFYFGCDPAPIISEHTFKMRMFFSHMPRTNNLG